MKRLTIVILIFATTLIRAESNRSRETNKSITVQEKSQIEQQIKKQIEREKKYAKEQKFYQGKEYDLDAHKVDPKILDKVPVIEPEYDFDMTDVYSD